MVDGGRLALQIAGIPIGLSTASPGMIALLTARYEKFLIAPDHPVDARLVLDVADDLGSEPPAADLIVQSSGTRWRITRGDFVADWDAETRSGRIRQTCNPFSTDTVLRILHSLLLAPEGGFLLHVSSLIWNGRAYAFTGPSGAGKTTMARLAPARAVLLTDEISCLRRTGAGFEAYGTPFAGDLGISGEPCSAPVAGVFRLHQGDDNRVDPLPPGERMRAVMRNVLFFADDLPRRGRILDAVASLVERVPVGQLTFRPEPAAWEALA